MPRGPKNGAANMKQIIERFIQYLRYERNVSPDTIREYLRDMQQFGDRQVDHWPRRSSASAYLGSSESRTLFSRSARL